MKFARHALDRADFEAIAGSGGAGPAIRALVAAERSKHLLLVKAVFDAAVARGGYHDAAAALDTLALVHRSAPHAADSVVCYPAVGAWALRLVTEHRTTSRSGAGSGLASIAAAAAILGRVSCSVRIRIPAGHAGTVILPALGYVKFPGSELDDVAVVRSRADGAQVSCGSSQVRIPADPRSDAPGWFPLRTVSTASAGLAATFVLDDQSTYRVPNRAARPTRLAEADVEAWRQVVAAGWQVLAGKHPVIAADVAAAISVLAPLDAPAGSHLSATARDAFGCVALSLPRDGVSMAATLAHEVQHAKLVALTDMYPLADPSEDRYYAPWRSDPRPLSGLLHGAYAHLGVTDFWRRQRLCETDPARARHAHAEFARWRQATRDTAFFLIRSGRLTPQGRFLVEVMLRSLSRWCQEPVPPEASNAARLAADRHRAQWLRQHGGAG